MSKVRFGVFIGPDSEYGSTGREHIHKIIKYLDSLDKAYESVWLPDHLIPDSDAMGGNINLQTYKTDYLECLTTTSYLLPLFPDLKFGHTVLCNNFRNPALLAKMTSTLQVLSEGRFILGIGAGWFREEYKQFGYEYPSPRTRIKQLEEAVQIIKLMWEEDGVTFHGKHYRVENAYCNPKPDPLPPIMIGGSGEKFTLKVVAKYADWWNVYCLNVKTWTHKMKVLANHCDNVGRDFDDILKTANWGIAIADSDEEALKLAKRTQYYYEGLYKFGTPESIVSQIGELVDAGVEYFQLHFPEHRNHETTQRFANEVIPKLT